MTFNNGTEIQFDDGTNLVCTTPLGFNDGSYIHFDDHTEVE